MRTVLRGGGAGLAATVVMSSFMALGKKVGFLGTPPPKRITLRAAQKVGLHPRKAPSPLIKAAWGSAHIIYGATWGVGFSLARSFVPGPSALVGGIYGIALWAANYLAALPALGLYPPPEDDRKSRIGIMIVAHVIYGSVLGLIVGNQAEKDTRE